MPERQEKFTLLSSVVAHTDGNELIRVNVETIIPQFSYQCAWKPDSTGYRSCGTPAPAAEAANETRSSATIVSPPATAVECRTPTWSSPEGWYAITDFYLVLTDGNGNEFKISPAWLNMTKFYFLEPPEFVKSPPENSVYVQGVDCAGIDLDFEAALDVAPARFILEYTPLIPRRSESFVGVDPISYDEVQRRTDPMQLQRFDEALDLDPYMDDGTYCIGPKTSTLQLPYQGSDGPQMKVSKSGDTLNVMDNVQQPSSLSLESVTDCNTTTSTVCGRLNWNVSRGWEGYAYEVCVVAAPAGVPPWALEDNRRFFTRNCIYVVVPKCSKCVSPSDSLYTIAKNYGKSWLDLWSVNIDLINTTKANPSTDETWNTVGDLAYPFVEQGTTIRTGSPYRIRPQDSLFDVSRRFGMELTSFLALNPDVVSGNQDLSMTGKMVCILASGSKYDNCPAQVEDPNPLYFEEVIRYDERGVPVKVPNDRYPLPPNSARAP